MLPSKWERFHTHLREVTERVIPFATLSRT